VDECGQCRNPLRPDGPSVDFCGDWCQSVWLSAKQEIVDLVGYREPYDLPQHWSNLVETHSPETAGRTEWHSDTHSVTYRMMFDLTEYREAFDRAMQATVSFVNGLTIIDEIHNWTALSDWQPRGILEMQQFGVLLNELRPEPEPTPVCEDGEEPFGADFDFDWRPAPALPDTPPPAVMPPRADRDWQALVDSYVPANGPVRRERAPRQLPGRRT
jgi:hypothetical protein